MSETRYTTFLFALPVLFMSGLAAVRSAALRGLHHVVMGQLPDTVIRPGLMCIMAAATWLLAPAGLLTPASAAGLQSLAAAGAFVVSAWLLWHYRPRNIIRDQPSRATSRYWLSTIMPLALLNGAQIMNRQVDLVMLGLLGSNADVGIYRVAMQGGLLVIFGVQALNQVVKPYFSSIYAQGNHKQLQRLATLGAYANTFMAIIVAVVFIVFGHWILGTVFGAEYEQAYWALCILAIGRVFGACMGQASVLLSMTRYERRALRGVLIALGCNVLLNLTLIPYLGMIGAAIAASAALAVFNLVLWHDVRRCLGVDSSVLGGLMLARR